MERPGIGWVRASGAPNEDLLQKLEDVRTTNDQLSAQRNALWRELDELKRASQPVLQGLADLNDVVILNYKHSYSRHGELRTIDDDYACTWGELFGYVGPQATKPLVSSSLEIFLEGFVRERTNHSCIDVTQSTVNKVRMHLEALKLVSVFTGNQVNGGLGEFMQVTDHGRGTLFELLAVRRPLPEAPDESGAGEAVSTTTMG